MSTGENDSLALSTLDSMYINDLKIFDGIPEIRTGIIFMSVVCYSKLETNFHEYYYYVG